MAKEKKGRQEALPGMESRKIKALQDAALDYAEIRDQRQALTAQEVELKGKLIDLMHKYDKETYTYQGVTITLIHEEESVRVKVAKQKSEEDETEELETTDVEG